jgi:hypothetical protein
MHSRLGNGFRMASATSRVLLMACVAMACSGCIGFQLDFPVTHNIRNPVPHKAAEISPTHSKRWACQPDSDAVPPYRYAKTAFLAEWGEPKEKVVNEKGEIWIYADRGQWCGLWVFLIAPIPVRLPVCDAYDHVVFDGEDAVSSTSHRIVGLGVGLGFHPAAPVPLPFVIRPGFAGSANPRILLTPAGSDGGGPCTL